jgi:hypothetical protein
VRESLGRHVSLPAPRNASCREKLVNNTRCPTLAYHCLTRETLLAEKLYVRIHAVLSFTRSTLTPNPLRGQTHIKLSSRDKTICGRGYYTTTRLSLLSGQSVNIVSDCTPAAMQEATVTVTVTVTVTATKNPNANANEMLDTPLAASKHYYCFRELEIYHS